MKVDVLEALGDYKCDAGMSVKNVPAVLNIKTLKGRFIAHKFSTWWAVGVVKSVEKKRSVAGQFAVKYKSETYCHKYWGTSCCCKRVNTVETQ